MSGGKRAPPPLLNFHNFPWVTPLRSSHCHLQNFNKLDLNLAINMWSFQINALNKDMKTSTKMSYQAQAAYRLTVSVCKGRSESCEWCNQSFSNQLYVGCRQNVRLLSKWLLDWQIAGDYLMAIEPRLGPPSACQHLLVNSLPLFLLPQTG